MRTPVLLLDADLALRGNVIVTSTGSLTLWGTTLRMAGDPSGIQRIVVEPGGRLATSWSPLTGRITRIVRDEGAGRFSLTVRRGGSVQLAAATIRGAGWDDGEPGVTIEAEPTAGTTIVASSFEENYVGLVLRAPGHRIAQSVFRANARAGLSVEGGPAFAESAVFLEQPLGVAVAAGSSLVVSGGAFHEQDSGIRVSGGDLEVDGTLFLDEGHHLRIEEGGSAAVSHSLFAAAPGGAAVVTGGSRLELHRSDFVGNLGGVANENPSLEPPVDATENYWGDPDGPGGAGPGSGDPVSEGVRFSPWCTSSCWRPEPE